MYWNQLLTMKYWNFSENFQFHCFSKLLVSFFILENCSCWTSLLLSFTSTVKCIRAGCILFRWPTTSLTMSLVRDGLFRELNLWSSSNAQAQQELRQEVKQVLHKLRDAFIRLMGKLVQFCNRFHDDDGNHFWPVCKCNPEPLNRQPIYEENLNDNKDDAVNLAVKVELPLDK
jgi:hypothetical protein